MGRARNDRWGEICPHRYRRRPPCQRELGGKGGGKGLLRSRARRREWSPRKRHVNFLHQPWKRSSKYRDGNTVIRPMNPCILTRYGKPTESNCVDGAGRLGMLPAGEGTRYRVGTEA